MQRLQTFITGYSNRAKYSISWLENEPKPITSIPNATIAQLRANKYSHWTIFFFFFFFFFQTLKGSLLRSQGLDLAEIQFIQDVIVILVNYQE